MVGLKNRTENTNTEVPVTLIPISKTIKVSGSDTVLPGIDVASHCLITGLIAHELLEWFSPRTQKRLNYFTLRTQANVNIQWLLYCIVHNLA